MRWTFLLLAAALASAPALADTGADRVAAVLNPHLTPHGASVVSGEANLLETVGRSEAGLEKDLRDGCQPPHPCFDAAAMNPTDVLIAMQVLTAKRAEDELAGLIEELKRKNASGQHSAEDVQRDMIRIQALMNKRNQAYDHLTQIMVKHKQALDGIIGNMR